jgi:hypothetical protein
MAQMTIEQAIAYLRSQQAHPPKKTFAQLDAATKDRLSHRGTALRSLAAKLAALLQRGLRPDPLGQSGA